MTLNSKEYLFVSDLDGTLLQAGGKFPQESIDRLNRLIDKGLNFSIATARNHDSAYNILNKLNIKLPVILFNGVYLSEFHTGETLVMTGLLPKEIKLDIFTIADTRGITPFVYTYGEKHHLYHGEPQNDAAHSYIIELSNDNRLRYTSDFFSIEDQVSGLLFIDTHRVLAPLHDMLAEKYPDSLNMYFQEDISNPGFYWLQIYLSGSNKGIMLKQLAERLEFPLSKVVAFGDYVNDLDMFAMAGTSIAMANALPEVKNAATHIIGSNEEGAVIKFLENLQFK
jgi:Cof subfamily protein (haloacid dehalogenase superfamily)